MRMFTALFLHPLAIWILYFQKGRVMSSPGEKVSYIIKRERRTCRGRDRKACGLISRKSLGVFKDRGVSEQF